MELSHLSLEELHFGLEREDLAIFWNGFDAGRIVILFHKGKVQNVEVLDDILDVIDGSRFSGDELVKNTVAKEVKGTVGETLECLVSETRDLCILGDVHFQFSEVLVKLLFVRSDVLSWKVP